jgi:hypothetical protein
MMAPVGPARKERMWTQHERRDHHFGLLMLYMGGRPFHNTEEVEVAARQWLRM